MICICFSFYLIKILNTYKKEAESLPWREITFLNEGKRPLPISETVKKTKFTDSIKSALSATEQKVLWMDSQAIIFSFMPVELKVTFPFALKAFISSGCMVSVFYFIRCKVYL